MRRLSLLCLGMVLAMNFHAQAKLQTETIHYQDGSQPLVGYLAYDDRFAGPRPGVIVVHEWWGLTEHPKKSAERLAELGYVGFALDMYGEGKTTSDPQQAGAWAGAFYKDPQLTQRRFRSALTALTSNPRVDAKRVAAIGYCFGGMVCLEMARAGLPLAGVVSFHGSLESALPPTERPKIQSRILVLSGAADPHAPLKQVNAFVREMSRAGADFQVVLYSGAAHAFTNPQADSYHLPGIAYNAAADRRSWEAMRDFLAELFPTGTPPTP